MPILRKEGINTDFTSLGYKMMNLISRLFFGVKREKYYYFMEGTLYIGNYRKLMTSIIIFLTETEVIILSINREVLLILNRILKSNHELA